MSKKIIAFAFSTLLIILFIAGYTYYQNQNKPNNRVIFAVNNKLYTSQLDKTGKKLLYEFKNVQNLLLLDYDSLNDRSLLMKLYKDKYELVIYSKSKITTLYTSNLSKRLGIIQATFVGSNSILFTSSLNGKGYISKINIETKNISHLTPFNSEQTKLQYSSKSNSLLLVKRSVEILPGIKRLQFTKHTISLYDINKQKLTDLFEGYKPLWLIDGETFLYNDDVGLNEYNISEKKKTKLFTDDDSSPVDFFGNNLSEDKQYLLKPEDGYNPNIEEISKQRLKVIKLSNGSIKKIDWEKQFQLKGVGQFPSGIYWYYQKKLSDRIYHIIFD